MISQVAFWPVKAGAYPVIFVVHNIEHGKYDHYSFWAKMHQCGTNYVCHDGVEYNDAKHFERNHNVDMSIDGTSNYLAKRQTSFFSRALASLPNNLSVVTTK